MMNKNYALNSWKNFKELFSETKIEQNYLKQHFGKINT